MRKTLLLTLIVVAGCGIYPDYRLMVNDHLRSVCGPFDMTDGEIMDLLLVMEENRLSGWSKDAALVVVQSECESAPLNMLASCWQCEVAMVEQIWGN